MLLGIINQHEQLRRHAFFFGDHDDQFQQHAGHASQHGQPQSDHQQSRRERNDPPFQPIEPPHADDRQDSQRRISDGRDPLGQRLKTKRLTIPLRSGRGNA